jgi:hypothetical protein
MVDAVGNLSRIDRRSCREEGERRFSTAAVVDEYARLYSRCLAS